MPLNSLLRLLLLAALWGGSFLFLRISAPVLGIVTTAFGRVTLGALGLLVWLAIMRVPLRFSGRFWVVAAIGTLTSGLPFLLYSAAAQVLPAAYSSILNAMTPLMGVLIGGTFFGEQVTPKKVLGVFMGLGGVVVLSETGPVALNATTALAVAACLMATVCYALSGFLTKRLISDHGTIDNRAVAFGSQVGGVIVLAPFMLWQSYAAPLAWSQVGAEVWVSMLGLGLLCTSFAYILFFRLISEIGALSTLTVTFLIPLFGVLWGWLLLHERLSLGYALGGGLIMLALLLVLPVFGRLGRSLAPRPD